MTKLLKTSALVVLAMNVHHPADAASLYLFGNLDAAFSVTAVNGKTFTTSVGPNGSSSSKLSLGVSQPLGNAWKVGTLLDLGFAGEHNVMVRQATVILSNDEWGSLKVGKIPRSPMLNLNDFNALGDGGTFGTSLLVPNPDSDAEFFRTQNSITVLPKMAAPFYGEVQYAQTPGSSGQQYAGARLGVEQGPFNVAIGVGGWHGRKGDYRIVNVGVEYELGDAKLWLLAVDSRFNAVEQRSLFLSAGIPSPSGDWEFRPSVGAVGTSGPAHAPAGHGDGDDAIMGAFEVDYLLSPNVTLYGQAGFIENFRSAGFTLPNGPTTEAVGNDVERLVFGTRVKF